MNIAEGQTFLYTVLFLFMPLNRAVIHANDHAEIQ